MRLGASIGSDRFIAIICLGIAFLFVPLKLASAQSSGGTAPQTFEGIAAESASQYAVLDSFGVNLSTNAIAFSNIDISVGSGKFPSKLDFVRTYNLTGRPSVDNKKGDHNNYASLGISNQHSLLAYFTCSSCRESLKPVHVEYTFVLFGKAYHFGLSLISSNLVIGSNDGDGSSLTILNPTQGDWNYQLITHDGIKAIFSESLRYGSNVGGYATTRKAGGYASYVEFPNGEFITFSYENSPTVSGVKRLKSVQNSRGYGFDFSYSNYSDNYGVIDRSLITNIQAFHSLCLSSITLDCTKGVLGSDRKSTRLNSSHSSVSRMPSSA